MSRRICEQVCYKQGHKMVSLASGKPIVDPVSKIVSHEQKILCERCGLAVDKIQNYRPIPTRRASEQQP